MTGLIIIPARWGSSRLPGKPLMEVAGRSLLSRVVEIARRASEQEDGLSFAVATDDERIRVHAAKLDCTVYMTDAGIASGSGRALAAALQSRPIPAAIINLQGDAPFIPVTAVTRIFAALRAGAQVATPVVPLDWATLDHLRAWKRRSPFSGTTCVCDPDGRALWFSKTILPAIRNEPELRRTHRLSPVRRHLGIYGYSLDALRQFEALPVSPLERIEGLEQLRLLEAGVPVQTITLDEAPALIGGIDTLEDVRLAESLLAESSLAERAETS